MGCLICKINPEYLSITIRQGQSRDRYITAMTNCSLYIYSENWFTDDYRVRGCGIIYIKDKSEEPYIGIFWKNLREDEKCVEVHCITRNRYNNEKAKYDELSERNGILVVVSKSRERIFSVYDVQPYGCCDLNTTFGRKIE